jgi:hypothetical protein
MGIVIPWPVQAPSSARASRTDGAAGGEIILFLGVRYERHAEREAPESAPESAPDSPSPRAAGGPARERRRRRG